MRAEEEREPSTPREIAVEVVDIGKALDCPLGIKMVRAVSAAVFAESLVVDRCWTTNSTRE